jgi:N-methylhydantoinase B
MNQEILPSKVSRQIKAGDVYRHMTGGGGGYGAPLERDPVDVVEDIRQGKLSAAYCESEYGVVVKPGTFELDEAATRKRRRSRLPSVDAA